MGVRKMSIDFVFKLMMISAAFILGCCSKARDTNAKVKSSNIMQGKTTYNFDPYGLSIDIPSNWIEGKDGRFNIFKVNCDTTQTFCPNVVVQFVSKQAGVSIDDYIQYFNESYQKKYSHYQVINALHKTVSNFDIATLDYTLFEHNMNLGGTTAITEIEDAVMVITTSAENDEHGSYVNHRLLFDTIISSLKKVNVKN